MCIYNIYDLSWILSETKTDLVIQKDLHFHATTSRPSAPRKRNTRRRAHAQLTCNAIIQNRKIPFTTFSSDTPVTLVISQREQKMYERMKLNGGHR